MPKKPKNRTYDDIAKALLDLAWELDKPIKTLTPSDIRTKSGLYKDITILLGCENDDGQFYFGSIDDMKSLLPPFTFNMSTTDKGKTLRSMDEVLEAAQDSKAKKIADNYSKQKGLTADIKSIYLVIRRIMRDREEERQSFNDAKMKISKIRDYMDGIKTHLGTHSEFPTLSTKFRGLHNYIVENDKIIDVMIEEVGKQFDSETEEKRQWDHWLSWLRNEYKLIRNGSYGNVRRKNVGPRKQKQKQKQKPIPE